MNNYKKQFIEKNTMLVREFDRYILEHPEFAEQLPDNALVVLQIEDDPEFNQWAKSAAETAAEEDNSLVYVTITELKPVRSRIKELRLEKI